MHFTLSLDHITGDSVSRMAASRDWNGRNAGTPSATVRPGPNVSRSVDTQSEIVACAGSDPSPVYSRAPRDKPYQIGTVTPGLPRTNPKDLNDRPPI